MEQPRGVFKKRGASGLLYRARPVPRDRPGWSRPSQRAERNPGPRVHAARGPRVPNHPVVLQGPGAGTPGARSPSGWRDFPNSGHPNTL
jgi:hypothetical protein